MIKRMKVIGIVGTAKNTGKTTVLSFILNYFSKLNLNIAISGIGFDGEEIDNITLLPKPRLYMESNIIAITSEKCLINSDVKYELLRRTKIYTALGEILIVKIIRPGLLVFAGPNKKSDLERIVDLVRDYDCKYFFVDGSLNRISPMSIVDRIIFTTGASRNTDSKALVKEMRIIEKIFSLNKIDKDLIPNKRIQIRFDKSVETIESTSLASVEDVNKIVTAIGSPFASISIPGFITSSGITNLCKSLYAKYAIDYKIILNSPIHLLLSSDLESLDFTLSTIENSRCKIEYSNKPELVAVTINPFYPRINNFHYEPGYIDKDELKISMEESLSVSVINVKDNGSLLVDKLIS